LGITWIRGDAARAQDFRHALADHDIGLCRAQGRVAQSEKRAAGRTAHQRHAEPHRDLGIKVLQPVDETKPAARCCPHRRQAQ
jgi:hypothetical protein